MIVCELPISFGQDKDEIGGTMDPGVRKGDGDGESMPMGALELARIGIPVGV